MVSKTDLADNTPTLKILTRVANQDTVSADVENLNNQILMNFIIQNSQWIRDSGVELGGANTYDGIQTFDEGLKVKDISPLTTNGNIILLLGTGKLFKNDKDVAENEYQTLSQVNTLVSSLTGTSFDLLNGGIKTTDFISTVNTFYIVSGATQDVAVELPEAPDAGDVVGFINFYENFLPNGKYLQIFSDNHDVQGDTAIEAAPEEVQDFYDLYLRYDSTLGWYRI